jgi:hypothetical protein
MQKKSQIATLLVCGAFLIASFQNCASTKSGDSGDTESDSAATAQSKVSITDIDEQTTQVTATLSSSLSCNDDSDCVVLPVGAKACGGPVMYQVASQLNPEFAQALQMIATLKDMQTQYNTQNGIVSDCRIVSQPSYQCESHACRLITMQPQQFGSTSTPQ